MRLPLIAISLWMFVLMTIFGVFGYAYVLWSQYWRTANERKHIMSLKSSNHMHHAALYPSHYAHSNVNSAIPGKIPLRNLTHVPTDKLMSKINTYKSQLMIQLRKAQLVASNVLFHKEREETNIYKVDFKIRKAKTLYKTAPELLCDLKRRTKLEMLNRNTEPFKNLRYSKYFLEKSFLEIMGRQNSCAIVSSAGSMHKAKLGKEIDAHDVVLRFNTAPTEEYEEDVGTKTTIRILNSQVVSKPEFDFFSSPLYRNITLIVWDPSQYHVPLEEWYKHPDFDLFTPYWLHRELYPSQPIFILNPEVVWYAWDFIQSNTLVAVEPNPPSSGFLGILVLMSMCNEVDVYEYVPSMRLTKRCHYFDVHEDIGCTLGDWHPLASEKILVLLMNEASDVDIFVTGKVSLPGFNRLSC